MKNVLQRVANFADSLAGRVFAILTVGIAAASILSLLLAQHARVQEFERMAVAASTADIWYRFGHDPIHTADLLHRDMIFGARNAPEEWSPTRPDSQLDRMLIVRLGAQAQPEAMPMPHQACFPQFNLALRAAGMNERSMANCWYVRFRDAKNVMRRVSVDYMPVQVPPNSTLDPLFLCLILGASAVLSFVVARVATAPLRTLSKAAREFSVTIDPEPIPERGPTEVRAALQTFNIMQHKVRGGFRERTQILSSIAHDLQTPLTRLRLRLEHVDDELLRNRLLVDLAAMQQLVRDGLDLARSAESNEVWSIVDIDSILSSIAEDAAEFDHEVRFIGGCGAQVRVKPNALSRCISNLVDNALKYGGDAELGSRRENQTLIIEVRDHGDGIEKQILDQGIQPFRRLNGALKATSGTGLGLAIAQAQARSFGAVLSLQNHPDGGLVASITMSMH